MEINKNLAAIDIGTNSFHLIVVKMKEDGDFEGLDAVIDKDFTASLIGRNVGADTLVIATDIQKVALDFNSDRQRDLDLITVTEAERFLGEGHFLEGSMGPKIEASVEFLKAGGHRVIITSPDSIAQALRGEAGTTIIGG